MAWRKGFYKSFYLCIFGWLFSPVDWRRVTLIIHVPALIVQVVRVVAADLRPHFVEQRRARVRDGKRLRGEARCTWCSTRPGARLADGAPRLVAELAMTMHEFDVLVEAVLWRPKTPCVSFPMSSYIIFFTTTDSLLRFVWNDTPGGR